MRTAIGKESVVCAHCGRRFTAPAHSGRYRQTSERRIKSARYCSRACRQAAYVARRAARADVPHSERHRAFRGRVTDVGNRVKGAGGTDLRTSVTQVLQPTEISSKIRPKNTTLGVVSIVQDAVWPDMYRLRFPDGRLTDLLNLVRAKDALAALGPPTKRPHRNCRPAGPKTSSATSQ
jgi:hypothetical protein